MQTYVVTIFDRQGNQIGSETFSCRENKMAKLIADVCLDAMETPEATYQIWNETGRYWVS